MIFSRNSFVMIGWFQLSHGTTRMVVAICGVSVIVAMILTVVSLKDAVIDSTLLVPKSLKGDVIVLSAKTQTILRPVPFPKRFLDRLHGIEGVESVSSVAIENARWVNPVTRQEHPIRVFGLDLEYDVIDLPGSIRRTLASNGKTPSSSMHPHVQSLVLSPIDCTRAWVCDRGQRETSRSLWNHTRGRIDCIRWKPVYHTCQFSKAFSQPRWLEESHWRGPFARSQKSRNGGATGAGNAGEGGSRVVATGDVEC